MNEDIAAALINEKGGGYHVSNKKGKSPMVAKTKTMASFDDKAHWDEKMRDDVLLSESSRPRLTMPQTHEA
jgi:hypothetical protein